MGRIVVTGLNATKIIQQAQREQPYFIESTKVLDQKAPQKGQRTKHKDLH